MASPSPTLGFRFGVLLVIVFGAVVLAVSALVALFFLGLTMITSASLAIGLLVLVTLFAAVGLALVFAARLIAVVLLTIAVFIVITLVAAPPLGIVAALLFLVLLGLALFAAGIPLSVPFWVLVVALLLIPIGALLFGILGAGSLLVVLAVLGFVALGIFLAWLVLNTHPMPLGLLGLGGLRNMPSVPLASLPDFIEAVVGLKTKEAQRQLPIDALTNVFTLGAGTPRARTATAKAFLFSDPEAMKYSLDQPTQFNMGWTNFDQVATRAAPLSSPDSVPPPVPPLIGFASALESTAAGSAAATSMFWENIRRYWNPFGILPIELITPANLPRYTALFGSTPTAGRLRALMSSPLFGVDMSVMASMDPPTANNPRFAPTTVALFRLLTPTPTTPSFDPIIILVSDGANTQVYTSPTMAASTTTPGGWLYALQALKASTTVWGIWLGHVYRYHTVTAAMQMTMFHHLPPLHGIRQVLGFQSKFLIGFDTVLLLVWSFPPPTPAATSIQFLQLTDAFSSRPAPAVPPVPPAPPTPPAPNRLFFDDDPEIALAAQGLVMFTFTNPLFTFPDINLPAFAARLRAATAASDPVAAAILGNPANPATLASRLAAYAGGEDMNLQADLVTALNTFIAPPANLTALVTVTAGVIPSAGTAAVLAFLPAPRQPLLNRMLLQDAFPTELWICEWNLYPIAHYVVSIHRAAVIYASAVVASLYPGGTAPADLNLQRWLAASATEGNVRGLPIPLTSNAQLVSVLASLIYRITAHGLARLAPVGYPGLCWVGNFPPCLEKSRIPDPQAPSSTNNPTARDLTTAELLEFLPKAGTIGEMLSFIFSFGFTDTFESLIPPATVNTTGGPNMELNPFVGLPPAVDDALQTYRLAITGFIRFFVADQNALNAPAVMNFSATDAAIHQWERNIEQ